MLTFFCKARLSLGQVGWAIAGLDPVQGLRLHARLRPVNPEAINKRAMGQKLKDTMRQRFRVRPCSVLHMDLIGLLHCSLSDLQGIRPLKQACHGLQRIISRPDSTVRPVVALDLAPGG